VLWVLVGPREGGVSHSGLVYSIPLVLRFGVISSVAIFRLFFTYAGVCGLGSFLGRAVLLPLFTSSRSGQASHGLCLFAFFGFFALSIQLGCLLFVIVVVLCLSGQVIGSGCLVFVVFSYTSSIIFHLPCFLGDRGLDGRKMGGSREGWGRTKKRDGLLSGFVFAAFHSRSCRVASTAEGGSLGGMEWAEVDSRLFVFSLPSIIEHLCSSSPPPPLSP